MRPKTSLFFTSNQQAARAGDGVHNLIRNAASAKFLFEVFPTLFASDDAGVLECKGEATTTGVEASSDAIAHFWLALEKAEVSDTKTRERVKTYWDSKLDEPSDYWDNLSFYSASHQQEIHVVLPLKKVFIAVASLLLGNQYFDEADASVARSARLTQLFDNLQQVAEHSGLCHTGVRDALLTPLNGVNFWLNDEKQCYRFPEHLSTYLQSLLSQYIEKALRQLGEENPHQHRGLMIAWFKMPEDEREMPDDLKVIVNAHLQSPEVQADYRTALLHVGLNPKIPDVKTQCEYIFSNEGLALINPSAALGSQAYWRDLERLFSLKPSPDLHHLATLQSEAGHTHGKEAIQAFQVRLKDFFRIRPTQRLLKTFELTLRYRYPEEAPTLCDTARAGIAEYHRSEAPPCLTDAQREALRQLQALVKRYQSEPLSNTFSNGFALLFRGNLRRKQARLLASREMVRQFNITDSWLDHFFPGDKPAGFELNIEPTTLNQVLLYALYYPQDTWPDRYSAVLTICLDYIEHKLGISEETPKEREDHQRLKQNSYPEALLTLLHLLNDSDALAALSDAAVKKQVDFCLKNNFYNALVIIHRLHRDRVDAHLTATHALSIHISKDFIESFTVILQHSRIDINANDAAGYTALTTAAYHGRTECLRLLLAQPAIEIDAKNAHGMTALMLAAKYGHTSTVQQLINSRANVNVTATRNGTTSLMLAVEYGHSDIVRLLIDAHANVDAALRRGATPLFPAAEKGYIGIMQQLIEAEANVNTAMTDGTTPLFIAVQNGRTETAQLLINAGADVNAVLMDGRSPLFIAALGGHTDIVRQLIAADANVDATMPSGATPLHYAAYDGRTNIVRLLIDANVNVNTAMTNGITPLYVAAQNGHTDIVRLLIEAEAEANVNTAMADSTTPLFIAIQNGHTDIVRLLIEAEANVNTAMADSTTPLFIAIQNGRTETAKLLINAGADVNAVLMDGRSPLFIAALDGHTDIVRQLIAADANVDATMPSGATPLHYAACDGRTNIVRLLINADVNVNTAMTNGITPLYVAAQNGHTDIVRQLIAAHANVNADATDGETPLYVAAYDGHTDIVRQLIAAHANVNAAIPSGKTPLYVAAQNGHADTVQLLIEAHANVNAAMPSGATPLYVAAQNGHADTVRQLIAAHANVNAVMLCGATPLYVAAQNGHIDIVRQLIAAQASVEATYMGIMTTYDIARRNGHTEIADLLEASRDRAFLLEASRDRALAP